MKLTELELKLQEEALNYIILNKDKLIKKYILDKNPLRLDLVTIFTAGSPGAGKTEFSKRYIPKIFITQNKTLITKLNNLGIDLKSIGELIIRIDVDEIRDFIPQYKKTDMKKNIKGNSEIIQKAANKGLDIIRNYCLENEISFLHDGTFGNINTMREIIKKSLNLRREVQIFYIYMDPLSAWHFTKAREYLEGRNIVKEKFIEQFFKSRENVNRIKTEFGKEITLNCVIKDDNNTIKSIQYNSTNIENFLKLRGKEILSKEYTEVSLLKLLD